MFENGLTDIDENGEKKATLSLYEEVNKTLEKNEKLYKWLDSLQKLAGQDAIIKYKDKKSNEWLTF